MVGENGDEMICFMDLAFNGGYMNFVYILFSYLALSSNDESKTMPRFYSKVKETAFIWGRLLSFEVCKNCLLTIRMLLFIYVINSSDCPSYKIKKYQN